MLELARRAEEAGREPPAVLREAPSLPEGFRWVWEAYSELDRSEHGAVQLQSMVVLLDELGVVDRELRREVRRIWRAMNVAELEALNSAHPTDQG